MVRLSLKKTPTMTEIGILKNPVTSAHRFYVTLWNCECYSDGKKKKKYINKVHVIIRPQFEFSELRLRQGLVIKDDFKAISSFKKV